MPRNPTFFCASFFPFFALSTPRFPRQFSSPKSPLSGTSSLLILVEKRERAMAGHRKKENPFFLPREKKAS